jgi:hypothetical protein
MLEILCLEHPYSRDKHVESAGSQECIGFEQAMDSGMHGSVEI